MKEIIFENISKFYGKTKVLENLNLRIKPGERLILLGASGCGKSTTLRLVAGLETISSGILYMGEQQINDVPSGKRNVSMVFQNYALFPHMTVEGNITYGLQVKKLAKDEIKQRLHSAVSMLALNGLEKRYPKDLSGGQRQRVALARAVVKRSEVLLLDEPLSNLDAQLRVHARNELVKIHQTYGQTFVYVTHDQTEAMTVGDRIAVMNNGNIEMLDTPYNVYHRPVNIFTASFIGSPAMNIFLVNYAGHLINFGKGQYIRSSESWHIHVGGSTFSSFHMGIRPEDLQISREKKPNTVAVRVKYVESYGSRNGIYFDLDGQDGVVMSKQNGINAGDLLQLSFPMDKIHLFDVTTKKNIGYPEEYNEYLYQYQSV